MAPRRTLRTFVVEGVGQFPFDMLRYDGCWPYSQQDSVKLEHHDRERRQVTLQTDQDTIITGQRWASFNWRVL